MDSRSGQSHVSGGSGSISEQLEDECQLWTRAVRAVVSSLPTEVPRDSVFWKSASGGSRCVCMSPGLSRFVRVSLLKVCDELQRQRRTVERLTEGERHLQADLRYAQEKMQLYRERLEGLQRRGVDAGEEPLVSEREQELVNSKNVANSRSKVLEARVEEQETEIRRLTKKTQELEKAELERQRRQQEIFRSFKSRKPTKNSPLDNKILDIIDSYETELQKLRSSRPDADWPEAQAGDDESGEPSQDQGYRLVIEELNQQVAGLAEEVRRLDNERELLSTELDSRPTNSDHVLLMSKLHRYERLLKRHNIDASKETPAGQAKEFSTRLEDVDMLPLSQCRKFLKEAASSMGVDDLKEMAEAAGDLVSISEAYGLVHPVLLEVERITQDEGAPGVPEAILSSSGEGAADRFQLVVPILQHWRRQLLALPELLLSLRRLSGRLYPWAAADGLSDSGADVRQLIAFADRLGSDESLELAPAGGGEWPEAGPPLGMLLGIVDHFRRLFDVGAVSAVLTKMNSVYAELGACRNALNSIRESMELGERCPPEGVVGAVDQLLRLQKQSVDAKLQEIFNQEDVQLALEKLEDYEQFFPIFEDLVKNLLAVLNVKRVDEILPAVASYKRIVDSEAAKSF